MTFIGNSNESAASTPEKTLQNHCRKALKSQLFRGNYIERRLVAKLNTHRDVVQINSTEKFFMQILHDILFRLTIFYEKQPNVSIGIGKNLILTEFNDLPFGEYYFEIKSIKFHHNEIMLKLKVQTVEVNNITSSLNDDDNIENTSFNCQFFCDLIISWRNSFEQSMIMLFSKGLTKENIFGALKFLALILLSLGTASIELLAFLSKFLLKLLRELRLWLQVSTPILLKLLDISSKIVGGIFILISIIWRDLLGLFGYRPPPIYRPQQQQMLQY